MKKIIILILLTSVFNSFAQRETFECNSLSKNNLIKIYEKYKDRGFALKRDGVDVIEFVIDDASQRLLTQVCIDAWAEVHNNGTEYTYGKFKRRNFDISYEEYLKYIDYLEIISELRYIMIKRGY